MSPFHVRWSIRRDLAEVLAIEQASYSEPWGEKEFTDLLRRRECIMMVCEYAEQVVGYVVYQLEKGRVRVLNLAVSSCWRRQGVGSLMLRYVRRKLEGADAIRNRVLIAVSETELPAQLFLRSCGFKAEKVMRKYFGPSEDAYRFVYRLPVESPVEGA